MGPGLLALGAAAALLRGAHAHAQKNSTCSTLVEDSCWYNPGPHVVATLKGVQTAAECCAACDKNPRCLAFTLNMGDSRTCYLKDGLAIQPHPGNCTSGGTILPTPPPPPTPPPGPAPPNAKSVLFIAIDDLRPELGAYGSHVPTPHLDAFAKEALVFTNAYIQYSFCCPSRNSFMTGRRREHSHPTTPPHPRSLGRACNKQAQQNPRLELHRAQPSHPCPLARSRCRLGAFGCRRTISASRAQARTGSASRSGSSSTATSRTASASSITRVSAAALASSCQTEPHKVAAAQITLPTLSESLLFWHVQMRPAN